MKMPAISMTRLRSSLSFRFEGRDTLGCGLGPAVGVNVGAGTGEDVGAGVGSALG